MNANCRHPGSMSGGKARTLEGCDIPTNRDATIKSKIMTKTAMQ